MASLPCTYALGKALEKATLPLGTDNLIVVLFQSTGLPSDTTLRNCQTLQAMLTAGAVEANFTGYCVDPQTECLTRRQGWTTYDQLLPSDELLAYDQETHTTRWESLDGIYINEDYSGPMWRLSMRGFSAVTTPNHKWPARRTVGRPGNRRDVACTVTTESLPPRTVKNWRLLRSAPFESSAAAVYSDAFVRIAAWYFTEGSLLRGGKSVTLCQSASHNPENVEEIRRDLKAIGAVSPKRPSVCTIDGCEDKVRSLGMCQLHAKRDYVRRKRNGEPRVAGRRRAEGLFVTERIRQRDHLVTWDLFGTEVDRLIRAVPGSDKVPTVEFLTSLTPEQARMFVEVSLEADGVPEERRFEQHNSARMDAFQLAAVLAGMGPTLGRRGTSCHLNEAAPVIRLANVRREEFDYTGVVWCPTLPSGNWVARREGKTYITGNSRKILTASDISITYNTTTFTGTLSIPNAQVWNPAGGAVNNTAIAKSVLGYRPTSGATDAQILPLGIFDASGGAGGGTYSHTLGALTDDA